VPGAQRAQEVAPRSLEQDGLRRILAAARDPADLRRRLLQLEPGALPVLFEVLVAGGPVAAGEAGPEPALGARELAIVREVLQSRPRRELVPFLEELAAGDPGPPERREALALLGALGSREHLSLLARLALPAQSRRPLPPGLRVAFDQALGAILLRDSAALSGARELFRQAPPALSSSIVEAIARTPGAEALQVLSGLLGSSPGLDPLILARIGERGPSGRSAIDEAAREAVRGYLQRREEPLLGAAARAAGALGDEEALERLIDLLDHAAPAVRTNAFTALERISGRAYGQDAPRWRSWYAAETEWWEEHGSDVLLRIERARGVEFARAARLALEHRLFRDRLAEAFALALSRRDVEEVLLAARALEELRSPAALPGLVECLERDEARVREAAWRALRAITGAELPADSDFWGTFAG
jgi:HEAT repeat protein